MFTGIISDVATLVAAAPTPAGREFVVRSVYDGITDGESIACDGVCLTVREAGAGTFTVAAVTTTLERTTLGAWTEGRRINTERSMALGERLGGHLVAGHVDAVADVTRVAPYGDALLIDLALDAEWMPLMVPHGSIAVNGVSLTVNELLDGGVQISLIEYTLRHTMLGDLRAGDRVNIEADMIGKFVQQLAAPHLPSAVNRLPSV
ncbi:MAG: riboflavin synthase [Gemmatimonadaceae bacterium]|nr:riboflavin synthase [Gemmatimonadaceae bacterium]